MNKTTAWAATLALPLMLATGAQAQTTPPSAPPAATTTAPGGMAATATPALSSADRKFIDKAAMGGMAEVQLAQLAQQKSQTDSVKQFAQKMIDDHTPNNEQLTKLAASKGVTPSTELDAMHQKEMTKLQGLDGAKFDKAYLKQQEKAHMVMLKLFKSEAAKGTDTDLKQFAESTIPTIESHEQMAKADAK